MSKDRLQKLFGFMPRGGSGLIGFVIVVIVAFSLGLVISGNGRPGVVSGGDGHDHAEAASAKPQAWTCSMHPQIKLPEPGKCPICFMDLIPLESGGDELSPRQLKMTETPRTLARIQTTPVRRADIDIDIRMAGKIAFDETRVSTISAWVPGRLDKLYADYTGVTVGKGDPLVNIYSPQLLSAQEELIQAQKTASEVRTEGSVLKTTARATLVAAREKLKLYGLTKSQIDEISATGKTSDHIIIYSPAGGVVVDKHAQEGMYVTTGAPIYTIADLERLWVVFEAYESDLPWLRTGQKVEFTVQSMPGESFEGKITFIDPLVDRQARIVKVRAAVDNASSRLKPDMFISGVVKASTDMPMKTRESMIAAGGKSPLLIPASAPLITGTRAVVYVEIETGDEYIYEGREVVLGPRTGDYYIVTSGLAEGERVVVNGAFKIDSELQILARPSMMYPEGGGTSGHKHHDAQTAEAESQPEKRDQEKIKPAAISEKARAALTPLYDTYMDIQMALARDSNDDAVDGFGWMTEILAEIDMNLFNGDAHTIWMELSNRMSDHAATGSEAADIDRSREAFYHLSQAVIKLHRYFGHAGEEKYYLTFCPMANNNTGAFWLQTIDTVYNSFYGTTMLHCGEIKETLLPGMANE